MRIAIVAVLLLARCASSPLDDKASHPRVVDPARFRIELFADLGTVDPDLDAFQLTVSSGENGFPSGLYVTPGPSLPPGGDRLLRIDVNRRITVVANGLSSAETMVFARGPYAPGILISEPRHQRIRRVLPDGSVTTFATSVGTPPFCPPVIMYGPDNLLYATGGSSEVDSRASRNILLIDPKGSNKTVLVVPSEIVPKASASVMVQRFKAGSAITQNAIAGGWARDTGFLVGTFTIQVEGAAPEADILYFIAMDGRTTPIARDLMGLELIEFGPGGDFGYDLYVATEGDHRKNADGTVLTISADGRIEPMITGIDAIDVAFDTQGVLGGGMFISDGTNRKGPGKVWRVTTLKK